MEFSKTNYIFIISDFPPTFEALRGSADFSRFKTDIVQRVNWLKWYNIKYSISLVNLATIAHRRVSDFVVGTHRANSDFRRDALFCGIGNAVSHIGPKNAKKFRNFKF